MATLAICIVFVPIFFLTGVGGFLFSPLAMAVVFAMLTSYLLSRTLVPTMLMYLMPAEERARQAEASGRTRRSIFGRISHAFEAGFRRFADAYQGALDWVLEYRGVAMLAFLAFALASLALYPFIGRDFFPTVDAGQLRLHVRAPAGTRIEQTEVYFQQVEDYIRQVIPADELAVITDNIGLPNSINLALSDSVTVGPSDGEILVSLNATHGPTAEYLKTFREQLPQRFPDLEFFAQPSDIVSQILNFGLPAPIDIQISGPIQENATNYQIAQQIAGELRGVPGAVDVHVQQILDSPRIMVDTDRQVAQQIGLSAQDVANSLSVSLSGSGTATTNFWLNQTNGVRYPVIVQTEQHRVSSIDELQRMPITTAGQGSAQLLGNLATLSRTTTPLSLNHYNVQPVLDVYASVQGTDLGSVSNAVDTIVAKYTRDALEGQHDHGARPGPEHEAVVLPDGARDRLCRPARVCPDGRELPVVAGPVHHPDGASWCARGNPLGVVRDTHDDQRSGADGLHHGYRRGDVEQHPDGHLREPAAPAGVGRPRRADRRDPRGPYAASPGAHDGARDAPGHAADEPWSW